MIVMGIDQSLTSTGIVIKEDGNMVHHQIITSNTDRDDFDRVQDITVKVIDLIKSFQVDDVVIEGLAFSSNGDATRKLAGLQFYLVIEIRKVLPIECSVVAPTTLKKKATGNGRANKDDLFDALPDDIREEFMKYNKTGGRFDVTDAYWLATC